MSSTEKEYGEIFREELKSVHETMKHTSLSATYDSYLLGIADGIVIMATHLGIVLRPDLVEEEQE